MELGWNQPVMKRGFPLLGILLVCRRVPAFALFRES